MSTVETMTSVKNLADTKKALLFPRIALAAAIVGSGLIAGLFYAWQVSVIWGLAEVDDVTYVTTFQALNDKIENPWFFAVFLGTPALIGAALALNRHSTRLVKALIGAGLVLNIVLVAITLMGNVPLGYDLADYDVINPETAAIARSDFEDRWNRLHLVRTLVSVAGFVSLTAASFLKSRR